MKIAIATALTRHGGKGLLIDEQLLQTLLPPFHQVGNCHGNLERPLIAAPAQDIPVAHGYLLHGKTTFSYGLMRHSQGIQRQLHRITTFNRRSFFD